MKRLLIGTVVLLQIASSLRANLGDTETEILKEYGKLQAAPVSLTNRDVTELFLYKGSTVAVTLVDGQSQRETFTKRDSKPFAEKELAAILDANTNHGKWVVMNDNDTVKIWVLDTKAAFAGYYKTHPYFSLETNVMIQFNDAVKAMRERGGQKQ